MTVSRRAFLGVAASGVVGSLAGCVAESGGGGGSGGTAAGSARAADLTLQSLDVAGSPGGEVPVRPVETVALLDFFATWCAPCKPQMKHLREVTERFPDVHVLSVTTERDEAAIRSFWKEYEGTWPVARDPKLKATRKYDARKVPTLLVLDADGNERWRHVGLAAAEDIAAKLEAAGASPTGG